MRDLKAFTLIELLVVTGIIIFLTALILPNYHSGERSYALQRSTHRLAQDLRRVEGMAMSMEEFPCPLGTLKGYGLKFDKNLITYSYRALCDSNSVETGIEVRLEKGVKIQDLSYYKDGSWYFDQPEIEVYFKPPDPRVEILVPGITGIEKVGITLSLEEDPAKIRKIFVNKIGLVYIE